MGGVQHQKRMTGPSPATGPVPGAHPMASCTPTAALIMRWPWLLTKPATGWTAPASAREVCERWRYSDHSFFLNLLLPWLRSSSWASPILQPFWNDGVDDGTNIDLTGHSNHICRVFGSWKRVCGVLKSFGMFDGFCCTFTDASLDTFGTDCLSRSWISLQECVAASISCHVYFSVLKMLVFYSLFPWIFILYFLLKHDACVVCL